MRNNLKLLLSKEAKAELCEALVLVNKASTTFVKALVLELYKKLDTGKQYGKISLNYSDMTLLHNAIKEYVEMFTPQVLAELNLIHLELDEYLLNTKHSIENTFRDL